MIDNYNSLSEKFLKKWFWLYLFSFIIAPIWYAIKIIISNDFSVWEVWLLYWIISLITIITAYNDLWMSQSTMYFIPRFVEEKRYDKVKTLLTYSFIFQIFTGLSIALFFYFWAEYIATNYFKDIAAVWLLKVFAFFFVAINIFQILTNFFLSIQNTLYSKWLEFIRFAFMLGYIFYCHFLDLWEIAQYSYAWLLWLYIWVILAIIIFIKKYFNKYFKNQKIIWSKELFLKIIKYSTVSFLWTQWATILGQIDMQMILILIWTEAAWFYTNYLTLISLSLMFVIPVFSLLISIFSQLDSKKEYDKIKNIRSFFNSFFIITWFILTIIFFIYSKEIAYIFFWEKFINSWIIIQYSILFIIFNILLQINFQLLGWTWKIKERTKIIYLAIILNIITNYFLIKMIWVYWAALATWIGWLFIWIMSEFKIDKKYKWRTNFKFLFKNFIIFWIIWIFLSLFLKVNYTDYSKIILLIIIWTISLILFLIFILINIKETKNLISNIKNR